MKLGACIAIMTCVSALAYSTRVEAQTPPPPADVEHYVWDLRPLYASDAAWSADKTAVLKKLKTISRFKGIIGRDARTFAQAMDEMADMRQRVANMQEYAILTSDLDVTDSTAQARNGIATSLDAQVESTLSFADYEIRDMGAARVERFIREQPRLEAHRLRIHHILTYAPHLLFPQAERLARSAEKWPTVSSDAVNALYESDLPWPRIADQNGGTSIVRPEEFAFLRKSNDKDTRHRANVAYFAKLHTLEPLFGVMLKDRIEADATLARARGFSDGMEALLFSEGMPPQVISRLIAVTRANSGVLRRYTRVRAAALGVSGSYEDSLMSPPAVQRIFSVAETKAVTIDASRELGAAFQSR
ncbi:MAG TPA: hypothetical protein VN860_00220, partial [Candidatus Acidoferrales bacterium]|nr:hypothetical protein [Candidatus Acidoferrales bacterium]